MACAKPSRRLSEINDSGGGVKARGPKNAKGPTKARGGRQGKGTQEDKGTHHGKGNHEKWNARNHRAGCRKAMIQGGAVKARGPTKAKGPTKARGTKRNGMRETIAPAVGNQ